MATVGVKGLMSIREAFSDIRRLEAFCLLTYYTDSRQLVLDSTHLCRTGRGVDICRRPDVRQFDWRNHVTTFDAVRMRVPARLADWLTTLAARRRP